MGKGRRAKGEGSIYKRKDGRFVGQYRVEGQLKYVYGDTKSEVKSKLSEELKKVEANIDFESENITLGKWLKEWLNDYARPAIKDSTYVSYETYIRAHIGEDKISKIALKDLKVPDFQKFINEKSRSGSLVKEGQGLSAKTICNMYNCLHAALDQATVNGYILKNPILGVKLPRKEKREMRVLSVSEQRKLMLTVQNSDDPSALGIDIALYTGMRLGEVLGLQWRDIDFESRCLTVHRAINRIKDIDGETGNRTKIVIGDTKTINSFNRLIPMMRPLQAELEKHLESQKAFFQEHGGAWSEDGFVVINGAGHFFEPKNYQTLFKKYVRLAEIKDTNFHALRHTFATRSIENGMDVSVLSKILGHSNPAITLQKYVHSLRDHQISSMEHLSKAFENMGMVAEPIAEEEVNEQNSEGISMSM